MINSLDVLISNNGDTQISEIFFYKEHEDQVDLNGLSSFEFNVFFKNSDVDINLDLVKFK